MKCALIAAGQGERIRAAGIDVHKPLVHVAGRPLVDRLFERIAGAGIREIACIFNEESDDVEAYCRAHDHGLSLTVVRKTTPSSMESLFTLAPHLDERFLLLTVDAVFGPTVLPEFLTACERRADADGVLAVTNFVDDEKPLWVRLDESGRITEMGAPATGSGTITAGFYVFDPRIFAEIEAARSARFTALRQFLGHLIERGYRLDGVPVGKSIDVDRPEDIAAAEALLK